MAGTVGSLGLSQRVGSDGKPLAGWKLSVFEAGTSTPVTTYKDFGLTAGQEHPSPIVADANGTMPMWWVADGTYRVRGTDSGASLILFDEDSIQALGPSSGEGGGGGGVDADALFKTGYPLWLPVSGTLTGFVRMNGRTIGSATSGATERANADCEDLYVHKWNNFSDTLCPVTGGRGANAAADWAANKPIGTLNMQGIGAIGLAGMGGSDTGALDNVTFSVGNKTTAASLCGAALVTLTEAQMPTHTHVATSVVTDTGHDHVAGEAVLGGSGGGTGLRSGTSTSPSNTSSDTTGITVATTNANTGSGSAHNNMQPSRTGTWYIKL